MPKEGEEERHSSKIKGRIEKWIKKDSGVPIQT